MNALKATAAAINAITKKVVIHEKRDEKRASLKAQEARQKLLEAYQILKNLPDELN